MTSRITEGFEMIDVRDVAALLKTTYWANHRSVEQIEKSMRHSECYGVYIDGESRLIGFARVITDHATAYYLCDVVIDPAYRHRGLGKELVGYIVSRPEYRGLRGLLLTRDADGFYEKFGFKRFEGIAMTVLAEE